MKTPDQVVTRTPDDGMEENLNTAVSLISGANEKIKNIEKGMWEHRLSQEKGDHMQAVLKCIQMAEILIALARDFGVKVKIETLKDGDKKEALLKTQKDLQQLADGAQKAIDEQKTKNIVMAIGSLTVKINGSLKGEDAKSFPLEKILLDLTLLKS